MAAKKLKTRIIHKHEIEANWELSSLIPFQGEIIVYDKDENYDYERIKIGDGVTNVNDLPFANGVGEKTPEGGEIFNDYENNKAIGEFSHAEGVSTTAGTYAFNILAWDKSNKTYTLDSVEGLAVGDIFSVKWHTSHINYGEIIAINDNTITVDNIVINAEDAEDFETKKLFIVKKPEIGTEPFDEGAHAEGWNTQAVLAGCHAEGGNTKAMGRYAHAEGVRTEAIYAAHSEGQDSKALGEASHSEGGYTIANANFSHTEGYQTITSGEGASHAEGGETTASGRRSHAEGSLSTALGEASHAEGFSTEATNEYAHAEGQETDAYGRVSHAEGYQTKASGDFAHSEGNNTTSSGQATHAEGLGTEATEYTAHAEGFNTTASKTAAHAEGSDTTAGGIGSHSEGIRTRAVGAGSHAEGFVDDGSKEKYGAIGKSSHIEGHNTKAEGEGSHAEGSLTVASGYAAHAEGEESTANGQATHAEGFNTIAKQGAAHAEGGETIADGQRSHAEGSKTHTLGYAAHAEGEQSTAEGQATHAEGFNTLAKQGAAHAEGWATDALGPYSHSEGYGTIANGTASHAEGYDTQATGNYSHVEGYVEGVVEDFGAKGKGSHAEGYNTLAIGDFAHSEGNTTTSSGQATHAEGISTKATVYAAHAEGNITTARNTAAHAEGISTIADGIGSHSEGVRTRAVGDSSHAEGFVDDGWQNDHGATGKASHVEGYDTIASGEAAHAEGYNTVASGVYSHAGGFSTKSTETAQTSIGIYNAEDKGALFIIGNGTSNTNRKNAFVVKKDGSAEIQMVSTSPNSVANKEYVDSAIANIENPKGESVVVDQSYNPTSENAQSGKAVAEAVSDKQDSLVSGTNIKTINNQSILGSGNITIEGGSYIEVDQIIDPDNNPITESSEITVDLVMETGALDSTGADIESPKQIRSDFVSVTSGSGLIYASLELKDDLRIIGYNADKVFVEKKYASVGSKFTIPDTWAYLRFYTRATDAQFTFVIGTPETKAEFKKIYFADHGYYLKGENISEPDSHKLVIQTSGLDGNPYNITEIRAPSSDPKEATLCLTNWGNGVNQMVDISSMAYDPENPTMEIVCQARNGSPLPEFSVRYNDGSGAGRVKKFVVHPDAIPIELTAQGLKVRKNNNFNNTGTDEEYIIVNLGSVLDRLDSVEQSIDCEYNKAINKAFAELQPKALHGTESPSPDIGVDGDIYIQIIE